MKQQKPKKPGRKKKPENQKGIHMTFRADNETSKILKHYTRSGLMIRSRVINELIKKAHAEGGL